MPLVLIEKRTRQITVVTLNRPERRNALTIELLTELTGAINVVSEEPHQRILILCGAGAAFCTGLDMTFLRRQIGERNMRELLLGSELIDAQRAKKIGLVNRVVAQNDLMSEAQKFADAVLQGAPGALAQTKRLIEELWWHSVQEDV